MLKCSLLLLFLLPLAVAQSSPAFVQELLPSAEKTALLYHLSYLCLANFPNLENIIRRRAVETQMLFMDSDATMLRCALTSGKLVHTLFPMMRTAAENNTPELVVDNLKKAQGWIKEINNDVDRMAEKYDLHTRDVASSVSDVMKEKLDTEARFSGQSQEVKQTEAILNYLKEVESSLTKIQVILIQLKHFLWSVSSVLGQLEQKTFAGGIFLEYLDIEKQEFIESIEAAKQAWNDFGKSCERTASIFKQQSVDAYKFLEVSHSSLSKEQWQEEYEKVKTRLEAIEPSQSPLSTERPAITQSSHSAPSLE